MKQEKYKQMSLRVSSDMAEKLDQIAEEFAMSRSAVINYGIGQFLRQQAVGVKFQEHIAESLSRELLSGEHREE